MIEKFKPIEPLIKNRFIIEFNKEVPVPEYLLHKFHIENIGEEIIVTTEIYQTVEYTFNPRDLFKITDLTLKFLDPTGLVVGGLYMLVSGSNMETTGDYSDSELLIVKFRFIVKPENINLLQQNIKNEENGEQ
jgi:hypothetical protein